MTSANVGDPAPLFALPYAPKELVDLSDHLGSDKIVLLFIPLAFSPVCTMELCTVRDTWADWNALDAAIFAISVDSPFTTCRFREEEEIPFPILSDFNREVCSKYDALHDELMGLQRVAKRAVFVIGTDGLIFYRWKTDNPADQPIYEEVRQAIMAAP